uniref:Uncharacterized protein n=1 Tax=Setaria viridis TaxID=4556 RepID=A0A4U6TC54_SETVI|nr:hypothetical protein SEVIR_8G057300v2 [Setaria viridis]
MDDEAEDSFPSKRAECRKFRVSIPAYIDFLQEMFYGVVVVGRSSCILGGVNEDEDFAADDEDLGDGNGIQNNPMSPPKKNKSPFIKVFKGLIDTLQAGSSLDTSTLMKKEEIKMELRMKQNEIELEFRRKRKEIEMEERRKNQEKEDEEIKQCIRLAEESGATGEAEEFYMATKLFEKKYNRIIFCSMKISEARFYWLARCCKDNNR